jgi:hypothetical protein
VTKVRLLACGFAFWLAVGCGPLPVFLPQRLEEARQKAVDDAWEKALSPVGQHDNQTLLDILIVTQAHQTGVDKFEFRSEKKFSGGGVIMTMRYDRATPKDDRFEIKVVDADGKVLRQERYGREQIERTSKELVQDANSLSQKKEQGTASPDELKKLAAIEARLAVIEAIFPKPKEEEKGKGEAKK